MTTSDKLQELNNKLEYKIKAFTINAGSEWGFGEKLMLVISGHGINFMIYVSDDWPLWTIDGQYTFDVNYDDITKDNFLSIYEINKGRGNYLSQSYFDKFQDHVLVNLKWCSEECKDGKSKPWEVLAYFFSNQLSNVDSDDNKLQEVSQNSHNQETEQDEAEIEDKLEKLKNLYEKELITNEEYKQRRAVLLDKEIIFF